MFDSVDARLQPKEPANRTRHLKVHTAHNTWLRLVYVNVHCGIVAVVVFFFAVFLLLLLFECICDQCRTFH